MVLKAVKSHTLPFEQGLDRGITRQAVGLVIMVGKNRIDRKSGGKRWQCAAGRVVPHEQTRKGSAMRLAKPLELTVQVHKGFPNELNAAVATRQIVKNLAVEYKSAIHLLARLQGMMKSGVVIDSQVAPEPHQTGAVFFLHNADGSQNALIRNAKVFPADE